MRPDYKGAPITGPWGKPWLIQRLQKAMELPEGHLLHGKDNPFTFGGGLRSGGFSKEAMDMFRPIFSFDYMGSAEFEWGAVPKAFQSILLSIEDFAPVTFDIAAKEIHFSKWDERGYKRPEKGAKKAVYLYAKKEHLVPAEAFIRSLAGKAEPELKESAGFRSAILEPNDDKEDWRSEIKGWLDLDNCLMFFIDKEMFEKTKGLLEGFVKAATEKGGK